MAIIDHLFAVIPMLGILIFVHELGHFLVAKACGVRVLKFSIGFGPPIGIGTIRLRWERGGTEYVVGWFPLGGFVRMLGETLPGDDAHPSPVPVDARPDEFLEAKPVWQKLSIVFAGPVMNLLLPILCLMGILWVGLPRASAIVGMVETDSPAARAGVEVGDRILSLDGVPIAWWDEVISPIRDREAGGRIRLEIERGEEQRSLEIPVASHTALDRFGAVAEMGWVGLGHRRLPATVGVPDVESAAAAAGLRSGDRIVALDALAVEDWDGLRRARDQASARAAKSGRPTLVWHVERPQGPFLPPTAEGPTPSVTPPERLTLELPASSSLEALGLVPAAILVGFVEEGGPAARAGLAANDLILAVDGDPIGSFESFASLIQTSGGRALEVTYSRAGRVEKSVLEAEERSEPGPYGLEGMEQKIYRIGVGNAPASLPGQIALDQLRNPLLSLPRAVQMSWRMTTEFLQGLGKLFTGEVGTDKLSGPIGIARIARRSLDRGWLDYVYIMMLISINLGILNLLPIPILDGGQAVIYSIEGIKRSPVSMRARELATQLGFALLVVLMGRAFWNDLTPFWSQLVRWLSGATQ